MSEERKGKLQQQFEDGCFLSAFGQKAFVKVRPSFDIDKIRFDFVNKGTSGKGFTIYVDTTIFDIWCGDILSRYAGTKILNERKVMSDPRRYRPYYRYQTGEKGEKQVSIEPSTQGNGFVLHGKTFDSASNKFSSIYVQVDYMTLMVMANLYRVASKDYWDHVGATINGAIAARRNHAATLPVKANAGLPVKAAPIAPARVEDDPPYAEPGYIADDVTGGYNSDFSGYDIATDDLPF